MSIVVNQILQLRARIPGAPAGIYRVVLIAKREGIVALYRMANGPEQTTKPLYQKPVTLAVSALSDALSRHGATVVEQVTLPVPSNAARKKIEAHERYDRNIKLLHSLVSPDVLFRMLVLDTWHVELERVAKNNAVSFNTVGRLLCRYFFVGLDVREACRPLFWVKGKTRRVTKKLGRPPERVSSGHRPEALGRNTTPEDREHIEFFYNSLSDQAISVAQMFREYEKAFRPAKAIVQANAEVELNQDPTKTFISDRQFRYTLKQVKGELALLVQAAGERKNNLRHRVVLGSARDRIPYPGHTYIIDATLADVYLISAFDRRRIIGRPVIYVVIDAFSSLIVSVHVALSGPSLAQARIAMFRALADKTRWLKWLGVEGLAKWLPQGCRPAFWLADRGELHSKGNYDLQLEIESSLSLAAAYRADFKALVERNFGLLNQFEIHWLPGAVRERVRERGTTDPRLDAVLTLKEFTRLIVRRVAILNFTRNMSQHLSAPLVAADVTANPVGFWSWGIEYIHGSASFLSYEECLRGVLPAAPGKVARTGVLVGKDRYVADWMREHESIRLAGHGLLTSADIISSPDSPGAAWCAMPSEAGLREVFLHADRHVGFDDSLEDILEAAALRKFIGQDLADDTDEERLALERENDREVARAQQLAKAAHKEKPLSKSARTSHIGSNRRHEEAALAKGEAATAESQRTVEAAAPQKPTPVATEAAPKSAPEGGSVDQNADYLSLMSAQLAGWEGR